MTTYEWLVTYRANANPDEPTEQVTVLASDDDNAISEVMDEFGSPHPLDCVIISVEKGQVVP